MSLIERQGPEDFAHSSAEVNGFWTIAIGFLQAKISSSKPFGHLR